MSLSPALGPSGCPAAMSGWVSGSSVTRCLLPEAAGRARSSVTDCRVVALWAEQVVEQRPVPQQRLAQVFCACLLSQGALPHGMREPVILDGVRMVNRDQLDLRVEVLHRVTPRFHDAGDEGIGSVRRLRWLVDEALLQVTPFAGELQAGSFWQRLDVELSTLLFTCAKFGLGRTPVVAVLYRPVVFRAEAVAEHGGSALPGSHHGQPDNDHHRRWRSRSISR